MIDKSLQAMHRFDPIGLLLVRKFGINSRSRALVVSILLGLVTNILIPWADGFLLPHPGIQSSVEDWTGFISVFIYIPIVWSYYCFEQPDMIRKLLTGFLETDTLATTQVEYDAFWMKVSGWLSLRRWAVANLLIALLYTFFQFNAVLLRPVPSHFNPSPWILLGLNLPLVDFLPTYMLCMILVRHAIVVVAIFSLFGKYNIKFHPSDPDGFGGMSFIGRFSIRFSYLLTVLMLDITHVGFTLIQNQQHLADDPFFVVGTFAYLILAPFVFFLPLAPPHKRMVEAKKLARKAIAEQADKLHQIIQDNLRKGAVDQAGIAKLEDLNKLSSVIDKVGDWPTSIATNLRWGATTILPFVPSTLYQVAKWYTNVSYGIRLP